jgi:predicted transposase/invertase (TIGR01784 family)
MPLNIDIRRDPWYQRGEKRGEVRGEHKATERMAKSMLKDGCPEDTVAKYTGLSLDQVLAIKKRIRD